MCKVCHEHASEDKKWYLDPDNFTRETWEEGEIEDVFHGWLLNWEKHKSTYERWVKTKEIMKGQAVTLDEGMEIIEMAAQFEEAGKGWWEVHPCPCVLFITGEKDYRCMNFGLMVDSSLKAGRQPRYLTRKEYEDMLTSFNRKGCVHKIHAFGLKFGYTSVATFCNCKADYCTELRGRQVWGYQDGFLKGHHVMRLDTGACTNCSLCVSWCQFEAMKMGKDHVLIDPRKCYGCGLCQNGCQFDALELVDRQSVPVAANLW